jgi:hypothetical protein
LALTTTIAILYHRQRPSIDPRSITLPADGEEPTHSASACPRFLLPVT